LTVIYSMDEVPDFDSDMEAASFWDTHTCSEELLQATSIRGPGAELAAILKPKLRTRRKEN
jgi:hypothetical protein